MKKLFFMTLSLFALNLCTWANASNDNDPTKKVNTYYGTEASNNPNNPCKGPTIRKCGEIVANYVDVDDEQTLVTKTVKDANGNIITIQTFVVPKSSNNPDIDTSLDPNRDKTEHKKQGNE